MSYFASPRPLAVIGMGAGLLVSSACSETALTGVTDDSELQDEDVVVFAALGTAREINDLIHAGGSGWIFDITAATDAIVQDGTTPEETDIAVGDYRAREMNGWYEQAHEAIWASYKIVALAQATFPAERLANDPIVARAWLNAGLTERMLGDWYCETTYQYGPHGGFNLAILGDVEYDRGTIVGKDSIFTRAAFAMERAIEIAEQGLADGVEPNEEDPDYFDPETIRLSAYAGLAQARAALASLGVDPAQNWNAAVAAAAEVPTDYQELALTDELTRSNENWDISWDNDDMTSWGQILDGVPWGAASAYLREPNDPRVEITECGNYISTVGAESAIFSGGNIAEVPGSGCDAASESGDIPRWLPDKYEDRYAPTKMVTGTEMRLIEAEAALVAGDLAGFTTAVNAARANYPGLTAIAQPATAGDFEFPNAEDDAWSILDREVLLDGYLDGRRLFHLHRWEHPFITGNGALIPRHRDRLASGAPRMSCMPIPLNECNLNVEITCPTL